jgi:hypothetical protein
VDPSLTHNEADRLLEIVAAYAWNHLTDDPFAFTVRVFSHLPDELAYLYPLKNRAIARTWTVGAFRAFQYNDMRKVRQNALRALMVSPTLVRNRGLMSILVRSLMSLRQMKHREAAAQDAAALADG